MTEHRRAYLAAYGQQWNKDHPDAKRIYWQNRTPAQRRRHRENGRRYAREQRALNPEGARAAVRRWQQNNPQHNAARRARLATAPGNGVSRTEWQDTLGLYGGRCAYCGKPRKLEMEHIDPLSKGGHHEPENVAPACVGCNRSKQDRPFLLWLISNIAENTQDRITP